MYYLLGGEAESEHASTNLLDSSKRARVAWTESKDSVREEISGVLNVTVASMAGS
jgi:hypothetical protein